MNPYIQSTIYRSRRSGKMNILFTLFVVIIVVAMLSFLVGGFVVSEKTQDKISKGKSFLIKDNIYKCRKIEI